MQSTARTTAPLPRAHCTECGLVSVTPIVVPTGTQAAEGAVQRGRCSNRAACRRRVLREANRQRARAARAETPDKAEARP